MMTKKLVQKIKNYAIISFIFPLIAINSCLLLSKFFGDMNYRIYPNLNWDKTEHSYTYSEYNEIYKNVTTLSFINCPKYLNSHNFHLINGETVTATDYNAPLIKDLRENNKIISITVKNKKILNHLCIKNYHSSYSLFKKFGWLEKIFIGAIQNNPAGFAKIRNPYVYGEVSISRTARYFPMVLIFKPLIILSAFFLFMYWKNTLNFFGLIKNENSLIKFSKIFFYFGVLSCIFLTFHAVFLGLDFDSKLFSKVRKLIIILFILCEIFAQIFLVRNLFKFRKELKKYINPLILNIKIIFVTTVIFATCVAFTILVLGEPSSNFKHILEWNYFTYLLLYYFLSRLLWK